MTSRSLTALAAAALLAATATAATPAPAATGKATTCRSATATVVAGGEVALPLGCSVRSGGKVRWLARSTTKATRTITAKPRHGTVRGTRYRPAAGYVGGDTVGFRLRLASGRLLRGTVRITVRSAPSAPAAVPAPAPAAAAAPSAPAPAPDDGLPQPLPLVPGAVAFASRNWTPTAADTCPKAVHERFSVIGPDGKKYPGWHPPTVVDPATGQRCTFGHEHGRDPRGSDIEPWVAEHLSARGYEAFAGLPFGVATEALNAWAEAHPGTPVRNEDHVGYKVEYENDVAQVADGGGATGVTCDYLTVVHQGSHSGDATANNAHGLIYAVRCDDGTELISTTVSKFGAAGEYTRSCDSTTVPTVDNGYPDGGGARLIPDRTCVLANVLVPAGRTTSSWALYEKWSSVNELRADGRATPIAAFNPAFGVFDPSRYANPSAGAPQGTLRTIDLCWETEAGGDRADGPACDAATQDGTIAAAYPFADTRSPFDGTHRDVYFDETTLDNAGGPTRWYTDPYGDNASTAPFPGALCQLVSSTATTPGLRQQVFGRDRDNDAEGVHAPN